MSRRPSPANTSTAVFLDVDNTLISGNRWNNGLIIACKEAQKEARRKGETLHFYLYTSASLSQASSASYGTALSAQSNLTRFNVIHKLGKQGINIEGTVTLPSVFAEKACEGGEQLLRNESRVIQLAVSAERKGVQCKKHTHLLGRFSNEEIGRLEELLELDDWVFTDEEQNELKAALKDFPTNKESEKLLRKNESKIACLLNENQEKGLLNKLDRPRYDFVSGVLSETDRSIAEALVVSEFQHTLMEMMFLIDYESVLDEGFDFSNYKVDISNPFLLEWLWELYDGNHAEVTTVYPTFRGLVQGYERTINDYALNKASPIHKKINEILALYKQMVWKGKDISLKDKANIFVAGKGGMLNAVLADPEFKQYGRLVVFDDKKEVIQQLTASERYIESHGKSIVVCEVDMQSTKGPEVIKAIYKDALTSVNGVLGNDEGDGVVAAVNRLNTDVQQLLRSNKIGCWSSFCNFWSDSTQSTNPKAKAFANRLRP